MTNKENKDIKDVKVFDKCEFYRDMLTKSGDPEIIKRLLDYMEELKKREY